MKTQENMVAFMGVAGANADLACRQKYPYMETLAVPSFEDVFLAVEEGKARYGLIPIENSQAGRVAEIHNILPRTELHIVDEHIQPVEHCLVGIKNTTLGNIKEVYSHPQALLQCRDFLYEKKYSTYPHSNTATAAKDVVQWNDTSKAAISSRLAAELYGLDILQEHIENDSNNSTLFITIAKDPIEVDADTGAGEDIILTSLLVTLRNMPSVLYKALGGFATNNVNLIKLESYIKLGSTAGAQFFLTFEGNPHQPPVQLALEELGFFSSKIKILGVYPADKKRYA